MHLAFHGDVTEGNVFFLCSNVPPGSSMKTLSKRSTQNFFHMEVSFLFQLFPCNFVRPY